MTKYIVSYDLHKVRDYTKLIDMLVRWGATKALASVWFVESAMTATQIRDAVAATVDGDDSIVVIELKPGSWWATKNAQAATNWLKTHIMA